MFCEIYLNKNYIIKKNFSLTCNLNESFYSHAWFCNTVHRSLGKYWFTKFADLPNTDTFHHTISKTSSHFSKIPVFQNSIFFFFFFVERIGNKICQLFPWMCQAHSCSFLRKCGPDLQVWIIIICLSSFQGKIALHAFIDGSLPGSSVHGDSPGKNAGVGCHVLLQEILPTWGLNAGLPHWRQALYRVSQQSSSLAVVPGPLAAVASLTAEHRL